MKVLKQETNGGILQVLTFEADGESLPDFKVAVQAWINENYPQMKWPEIFSRMTFLTHKKISLSME